MVLRTSPGPYATRVGQWYGFVARLQHSVIIGGDGLRRTLRLGLDWDVLLRPRSRFRRLVPTDAVAQSANRQLIVMIQTSFEHTDAVDPDPIGAAQIAYHQIIGHLSDTAVTPGDFARIDLDVALWVSADQEDRLIHNQSRSVRQGHELCRHGTAHPFAASVSARASQA